MAQPTVNLHTGAVGLDLTDFARFAKALRKAEPVLAKGLTVKLRAAGAIVAEEAKHIAGEVSSTVPASIKVRVSGATISVVAGKGVPLAALLEVGNAGGKSGGGTFRHPIWGHWVTGKGVEKMHPFLGPAVDRKAEEVYQAAIDVLDEAIEIAARDEGL